MQPVGNKLKRTWLTSSVVTLSTTAAKSRLVSGRTSSWKICVANESTMAIGSSADISSNIFTRALQQSTFCIAVVFLLHGIKPVLCITQYKNRSFKRRSSEPITYHGTEETKLETDWTHSHELRVWIVLLHAEWPVTSLQKFSDNSRVHRLVEQTESCSRSQPSLSVSKVEAFRITLRVKTARHYILAHNFAKWRLIFKTISRGKRLFKINKHLVKLQ